MSRTHVFLTIILFIGNPSIWSGSQQPSLASGDNFEEIRLNHRVCVDKSGYITKLLNRGERFMRICRPPNFGKSTFLQMIDAFFRGKKEWFKDLAIYSVDYSWRWHPTISLDFNSLNVTTTMSFETDLKHALTQVGRSHGIEIDESYDARDRLNQLMKVLRANGSELIVLIDEYDWPVRRQIEHSNDVEIREMEKHLKRFFSVFDEGDNIRLLFMTCTMPLDLNVIRLVDISFESEFEGMIGLRHEELIDHFKCQIDTIARNAPNETFHSIVQTLKRSYNGFSFSKKTNQGGCRLFAYSSVISCLRGENVTNKDRRGNHMIQRFLKRNYRLPHEANKESSKRLLLKFFTNCTISLDSLRNMVDFCDSERFCENPNSLVVTMTLYGYLTFRNYDEKTGKFTLDFPNEEARAKLVRDLLHPAPAAQIPVEYLLEKCKKVKEYLFDGMAEDLFDLLSGEIGLFLSSRESNITRDCERTYIERIVKIFQMCDIASVFDPNTRNGVDLIVAGPSIGVERESRRVFVKYQTVFEFEWNKTADCAMDKILKFFKSDAFRLVEWDEPIHAMAVNFIEDTGEITDWVRVTYHSDGNYTHLRSSLPQYIDKYGHLYGYQY